MSAVPVPAVPSPESLQALLDAFPQLRALLGTPDARDVRTVGEVIELYLAEAPNDLCTEALAKRARELRLLVDAYGDRRAADMTPHDLRVWLRSHPKWKSDWTTHRVNVGVQRAFNWAVKMRLLRDNPFKGLHCRQGGRNRPMTDEEFLSAIRSTDAPFRRVLFFLRYTGCRPGEMSKARWRDVDFENSRITLAEHKTAHSTGLARFITLLPVVIRLLKYLQVPRPPSAFAMRFLLSTLADGPRPVREVLNTAKARGIPYHALRSAMKALNVVRRTAGPSEVITTYGKPTKPAPSGYPAAVALEAVLASGAVLARDVLPAMLAKGFTKMECFGAADALGITRRPIRHRNEAGAEFELIGAPCLPTFKAHGPDEPIFLNTRGRRWTRYNLATRMKRLRKRLGLPKECKLYGLRHKFGNDAAKNGLGLAVVAALLGHAQTRTTERYTHVATDTAFLANALERSLRPKSLGN